MTRGRRERWHHRGGRARRLQTRLFLWFLGAIVLAIFTSAFTFHFMQSGESNLPSAARITTRSIASHVAARWDDPRECDRYLERVHETVGLQMRIRRDRENLPRPVALQHGATIFDKHGQELIPIVRDGVLVGAVELDAGGVAPRFWNLILALCVALVVLAVAARFVSRRLAWPLEEVAHAAERFGGGELGARTGLGSDRRYARWVAAEVRDVAVAFDTMAQRIERVVREQRELLGAISHELRSPLGRARVALEIARERSAETAEKNGPVFDDAARHLSEADAILGNLLAAARVGLADLRTAPTPLLAWLRARIATEPTPPTIELSADSIDDALTLALEPALMNRALHNVFANARAHGHPDGEPIEVKVTREGDAVRVAVRDRGPGFPADLIDRAFDPFVKGDAARTPSMEAGAGLGLALVRRIIEAHGGRAVARNVEGGGAEVAFELPLSRGGERA